MFKNTVFIIILLLVFTSLTYSQKGFMLGVDIPVVSLPSGDIDFDADLGAGFKIGYGFNEQFSMLLTITGATHTMKNGFPTLYDPSNLATSVSSSDWTMGWVFFDGKYLFNDTGSTRWFIHGELGASVLIPKSNNDYNINGFAVGIGGGVEYFFSKHWSLNGTACFGVRILRVLI